MDKLVYYKKNKFDSKKETIVFLHGLTGNSRVWTDYYKFFSKEYNVLLIDLVGNGRSYRPFFFKKYGVEYLSKSIKDILKKENINRAHFVAHSYSFLIMLELNEMDKDLCLSCIFISPYYPNRKKFLWKIERFFSVPFFLLSSILIPRKKRGSIKYDKNETWEDFNIRRVFSNIWVHGVKSYVLLNYYSLKYNHPEKIRRINFPVLIITGKEDGIVPLEEVKIIKDQINNSKLIVLKNRSHILVYPFFEQLIPILNNFFKEVKHGSK